MSRVTGRDTAYRDKPCRRADYGFQPSLLVARIALWFQGSSTKHLLETIALALKYLVIACYRIIRYVCT